MPATTLARGNELYDWIINPTFVWSGTATNAANTELTTPLLGIQIGDFVSLSYNPGLGTATTATGGMVYGLDYINVRVVTKDVLNVTWANGTAGALAPPTTGWLANIVRPEAPNNLPTTAA